MTRSQTTFQRLAFQSIPSSPICRTCLHQTRLASSLAASVDTAPTELSTTLPPPTPPLIAPQSYPLTYRLKASVLLSRPPLLTRDLTPFEKSYFLYQRRLNERLALPFTRYFYYQRGTPGDIEWKRKIKERKTPARDIGVYNAYGDEGWNDELLVGDRVSEPEEQLERLLKDAEVEVQEGDIQGEGKVLKKEQVERPMPRVTEADKNNNTKSLNRALQRTIYLVVKNGYGQWGFPSAELARHESLHTSAERIIVQTGGLNMNTWIVGNIPIGHHVYKYNQGIVNEGKESVLHGEKIFFMKARILAGQADLKDNQFGLEDFQWLAKEEIQKVFDPRNWNAVRSILPER